MTHLEPVLIPRQTQRPRRSVGRAVLAAVGVILILILGATGFWVLTHQQRVSDQIIVWQFEPTSVLVSYAERATMTDEGRFLFYASRPSVESTKAFDRTCSSQIEGVGILGCYVHSDRRIYLFDVTDTRLDGIEEVVAAHEMLHAAWHRMSDAERAAITPLLEAEAASRTGDTAFEKTMQYYATAEPGERLNELHSIIGTEFSDISPELEKHYARFFSDRSALVQLHLRSNAVFSEREKAITDIVDQTTVLKSGIDEDYSSYNSGYDTLNADISAFNAKANDGGAFSQREFETQREALVARQAELDTLYSSIAARVAQYDDLVTQLEALNAEVTELNKSINIEPRKTGDS